MLRTLLASVLAFFAAFFALRLPSNSTGVSHTTQITSLWTQILQQLHLLTRDDLTIELDYGYFRGKEEDGVQVWLGIPYAQDPVGDLRFAAPQTPLHVADCKKETFNATHYSPACPSQQLTMNPDLKIPLPEQKGHVPEDEACLSINVFRPKGLKEGAKVPVIFFIHGGGFALGTTSTMDAGRQLISRAVSNGVQAPLVYISANYRVNAFGFLAGEEIAAEGGLNAGLLDQRLALQWAQKYVHLFGGDPERITVWGQSAGAISIGLHMVMSGPAIDPNEKLFRGAVMQSGAPMPLGSLKQGQEYFDELAALAGCADPNVPTFSSNNSYPTKLACLRALPMSELVDAIDVSPNLFGYASIRLAWQPRVDGVLFAEDPVISVEKGKVMNVPFVSGACDDEGTLFALASLNVTTDSEFREYMKYIANLDDQQAREVAEWYPDDQTQGAPFGTADRFKVGPQYKRIAAFVGDWTFLAPRRQMLQKTKGTHKSWAYLFKRMKERHFLGTTHGTDFALLRMDPKGMDFLINFAHTLDPNVPLQASGETALVVNWPEYASEPDGALLVYTDGDTGFKVDSDIHRREAMALVTRLGDELGRRKGPGRE